MSNANQLVVVFNTLEPYGYELVNLLAYPAGFTARFRFDDKWFDAPLAGILTGATPGYIVLRDFRAGRLYPVRRFVLLSYSKIGVIHHLQCELGELFEFDSDENRREIQFCDFNTAFCTARTDIQTTNQPDGHMKPLVFMSGYDPSLSNYNSKATEPSARDNERWANLLSMIRDIDFYVDSEFLRIIRVSEQGWPDRRAPVKDHSFLLKRSLNYEIVVAQYRPGGLKTQSEPRDIELKCDDKNIISVRPLQRAVGKYDILSFVLRVEGDTKIKKSFFDLKFTPAGKSVPYVNPLIQVPVEIDSPMRLLTLKALMTTSLAALYFFPAIWTSILPPPDILGVPAKDFGHDLSLVALAVAMTDLITEIRKR